MSGKGGRKNLGTVVECSETGDECNLPLLTTANDSTLTENENKESIQEASISNEKQDSEQSKTVIVDSLILDEHVNQQLNRSREDLPRRDSSEKKSPSSVFAQSRLNFINFINNIAAPVRSTKNKNKSPTSNHPSSGSSNQQFAQSLSIESSLSRLEIQIREDDGLYEDCGTSMAPSEAESEKIKKIQCDSGTMFAHESVTPSASNSLSKKMKDCPLCYFRQPQSCFPKLTNCSHRSCKTCLAKYLQVEIMESRVNISCPECSELMHQNDIYTILNKVPSLVEKYENFSLRRILMTDPDTRWCPAPDCTYAVIATSCAACPQLKCERPGCNTLFCYHCKGMWHNNQTCDEARRERAARLPSTAEQGNSSGMPMNFLLDRDNFLKPGDVKACPRCKTLIVKMNDGSCNHMVCAMCGAEFCWLCLKVITDLHYLSPTGCTFWGKRPWTKKKKLLWQIGILIGAPVGIALIGGLAVPGIIFGVPVFIGRKAYQRFEHLSRGKRRLITAASVIGSLIVSPVLAVMAVGVGVPIMLAYVYGVVPLSLCRNGACGGAEAQQDENPYGTKDEEEEIAHLTSAYAQVANERARLLDRQDGTSVRTGFSINSGLSSEVTGAGGHRPSNAGTASCKIHVHDHSRRRPSIESGVTSLGEKFNFDGASVNAMAGSRYDQKSVHTVYSDGQEIYYDEAGSTKALAGSVLDTKSLTDSCGRHTATGSHIHREREMSPNSFDDHHQSKNEDNISNGSKGRAKLGDNVAIIRKKSKSSIVSQQHVGPEDLQPVEFYCSEGMPGPSLGRQSTSSDVEDGADPYKVHAIMDNLKQILNDDSADGDRPRKQGKNFKKNPNLVKMRQTRASSKNFGQPVAAQINENQAIIVPVGNVSTIIQMPDEDARSRTSSMATSNIPHFSNSEEGSPKRSFFSRLFRRNKKSETK